MKKFNKKSRFILALVLGLFFVAVAGTAAASIVDSFQYASHAGLFAGSSFAIAPMMFGKLPTPQEKAAHVNRRLGNRGANDAQGSTRIIYDTLPLDGRQTFNFFENCGSRPFPLTNLSQNKLEVQETLIIQRASLAVVTLDASNNITAIQDVTTAAPTYFGGEFTFLIANSRVVKSMPLLQWSPTFNANATFSNYNNFKFRTDIVIPSLLEFIAQIRLSTGITIATKSVRLTIEGVGGLTSVKNNL